MSKTALIVDDTSFMRMTLKDILENSGYQVIAEAANGVEAMALYKKHRPQLTTLDIVMPVKDGLETVREIIEYDGEAKVIMVSAMGQQDKVISALNAGAKDFIVKPFKPDRVRQALSYVQDLERSEVSVG